MALSRLARCLASGALAAWVAAATTHAHAESQLLYLAEDVPAGLDFDGPSASTNTSQVGFINLLEPLVSFAKGPITEEGIQTLDFSRFDGRLAERWEYDEASLTWTFHLRHGVTSCAGNPFTADDVIYSLARGKSVSGATAVAWFLPSVASVEGFTRDVLKGGDKSLGAAVQKVDDYTFTIK